MSRMIGQMFTKWRLQGLKITEHILYNQSAAVGNYNGQRTKYASVTHIVGHPGYQFAKTLHIVYRTDVDNNPTALLSADIHHYDNTVFIKNATLKQLDETFNP